MKIRHAVILPVVACACPATATFAAGDLKADDFAVVFDVRNGFDPASDHYDVFCKFS